VKEVNNGSTIKVPFGPQHPVFKEPENFLFEVEGERIVNVKPRLGYNHRGMEKAFEHRTYIQNIYLAERICGICSDAHTTCYVQAVEELLDVQAPLRAEHIRVIIAELERIQSHALWIGLVAHEIGFDTLFMYVWRDREIVLDLFEKISGNRIHYAMNTIGGVRRDIDSDMTFKIRKSLDHLVERVRYYLDVVQNEQSILKRAAGVGILKPEDGLNLCAVGPTLRASGLKYDVRVDDSYGMYSEIPFNVVKSDGCDVHSRVIVRCEEMLESIGIILYVLGNMPEGIIKIRVPPNAPEGEAVSRVEAPRGELIHYAKSNGTRNPERYKVRSPTLANIPALCKMLQGGYVADIPVVLAGIDPCFSCMDRMAFVDVEDDRNWIWTMQQLKRKYAEEWSQK
jgi:NADH-quinone oxidoreductase subunit D